MHASPAVRPCFRRWLAHAAVLLVAVTACLAWSHVHAAPAGDSVVAPAVDRGELIVANRPIVEFRAEVEGVSTSDRARFVAARIADVIDKGGPLAVSSRPIEGGAAVLVDDQLVFRLLDADVAVDSGQSLAEVTARTVANLQQALDEVREVRDVRAMLIAIGVALLATAVALGLLWALARLYRWSARRLAAFTKRRADRLEKSLGTQAAGQLRIVRLVLAPLRVLFVLFALLLVYEWLAVVLQQFPYTRPWGEALLGNLSEALREFVLGAMRAVPGLLFVLVILLIARFFTRVLRTFFSAVEQGRVSVGWIDETTARPTGRLLSALVWLLALVAAYPYFPGSGSEAFKGIGVFVGLMLSIGSSGVVNQAVSGLMLMYTRSFRPGEFVRVGDTEGTVRTIGFLTTQIETPRQEQVTIPNAVIVGNVMRNFSRLKEAGGARVTTAITIGYDTPWRQVQAMLQLAAARTPGVLEDPPVRVLQTGLLDHAVEYTILIAVADPATRAAVLDALHASIQDVFNEYGVQIMSPRYEADPAQDKVVPPAEWFRAPAQVAERDAGKSPG
jgi:small-conductance mechanosensitive channel